MHLAQISFKWRGIPGLTDIATPTPMVTTEGPTVSDSSLLEHSLPSILSPEGATRHSGVHHPLVLLPGRRVVGRRSVLVLPGLGEALRWGMSVACPVIPRTTRVAPVWC